MRHKISLIKDEDMTAAEPGLVTEKFCLGLVALSPIPHLQWSIFPFPSESFPSAKL